MYIGHVASLLASNTLKVWNPTTRLWETQSFKGILESDARQASGRFSLYSSRELLTPSPLPDYARVVHVGSQVADYIVYQHQLNDLNDKTYLHAYTLVEATTTAQKVTLSAAASASGMPGGTTTETVDTVLYPVLLQRLSGLQFGEVPDISTTRFEAILPSYCGIDTQHEVLISGSRYHVNEAFDEYLCRKLTLIKR